ncbi:hypothetical protein ML462_11505 [Gramella lutea]|uniref:Sulfotransferase family protein n=1 Tax=Christiangramia lutea TaxID=1607951 RepID=A0A9X2AB24_9FLAO|nr:sulfotransferase [Christiangramia lutea]MCH4823796.1 hypothetical protein [Christiangramia lutea]
MMNVRKIDSVLQAYLNKKIFCISFQKTGTTSVGKFFMEHDYRVATYPVSERNEWSLKWLKGDYESIFNSSDFKTRQVFEDNPWWYQDFYKFLFHRFPKSRFILFERDADKWFDSLKKHSSGRTLGNTYRHSKIYRREWDFYQNSSQKDNFYSSIKDESLTIEERHREHYKALYLLRIREIKEFFNEFDENRLDHYLLEDPEKWQKLGKSFNIDVAKDYSIHANKTTS